MRPLRPLTAAEIALIQPEIQTYLAGVKAQEQLQRMIGLLGEAAGVAGLVLDVPTMSLYAPESEGAEAPESEGAEAPESEGANESETGLEPA